MPLLEPVKVMRSFLAILLGAGVCVSAFGAEFRSIAENGVVMYDAPSRAATPLFVAARFYPVEVIVSLEAWIKVRDHTGALSWVERKSLSEKRMVIVTAAHADALARAEDGAPPAFTAAQSVALELVEILPGGWARVRHADGATGYVKAALLWGD